jgi:hypothetical protein
MIRRFVRLILVFALVEMLQTGVVADDFCCDGACPTCGKVCKLVCSTKKLTATCYGCESKDICLPGPSRRGCKHCATCYGKPPANACDDCQNCVPKCEFCWRDWFACGCAQPRTVRVLTKYQAEKEICWYHWEVVDAASCCDCVSKTGSADKAKKQMPHTIFKPAPEDAQIGDVLAISDAEWVKLAAVLSPDPNVPPAAVASESPAKPAGKPNDEITPLGVDSPTPSFAERIQRLWKK